ncbi:MAG: DUF502 domain-containing protein [Nitrospirota bacterium]
MGDDYKSSIKKKMLAGLFVTFPLVLSILAVVWLFKILDGILGGEIYKLLGREYPGLGLILSLLVIYTFGTLATTVLGKKILDRFEHFMLRLPVFKSFYSTFKQLGDAFSPENRSAFKKFVIVQYPREGVHSFGFLTKECSILNSDGEKECHYTVYIPTNNLYLGDVRLFKKDQVILTDISIEEGIKILLSAGIAAPSLIIREDMTHITHVIKAPPVSAAPAVPNVPETSPSVTPAIGQASAVLKGESE